MMTYRKLGEYVAAEPFRPFRIKMASGQSFDIRHPEMILVGRTSVRVHTVTGTEQGEKWHDASMLLMETIEPLDAPVSQKTVLSETLLRFKSQFSPRFRGVRGFLSPRQRTPLRALTRSTLEFPGVFGDQP